MGNVEIAPSVLAADRDNLEKETIETERGGAGYIHIDYIERDFIEHIGLKYEGLSIGIPEMERIRSITKLPFDVHIMAMDPQKYIDNFIILGADIITFHIEAVIDAWGLCRAICKVKDNGVKLGIALNPDTDICDIKKFLSDLNLSRLDLFRDLDLILIMSVWPGKSGQDYIEGSEKKVREIRKIINGKGLDTLVEVDGGINIDNARRVAKSSADILVVGNSIFGQPNIEEATRKLKRISNNSNS